ncbi:MAG: hypothetical protein JRL30_00435 [Deltaproteobacteria bacterium]|nr:hypothetical protein [Deltaproteobacteria bacterium]
MSVWVGFTHIGRLGSWIPIVGGTILFVTICSLYFRATKTIWRRLHREEVFDI